MKSFIIILFLLICLVPMRSIAQNSPENDVLMGNIELLNGKIKDINSRIGSLKAKMNSIDDKVGIVNQDLVSLDSNTRNRFAIFVEEFNRINVDYKATLKQIELFRSENSIQEESIISLNSKLIAVSSDVLQLSQTLIRIDKLVSNIPEIYSNPDAMPRFGVNLALVKFVTFGLSDVNVEPVYTIGASYRLLKDLNVWGEFSSPFVLSLSRQNTTSGNISDKWNAQLYSFGVEQQFRFKNIPDLNIVAAGGLFLASVSYDKYGNNTIGIDRSKADGISTFGANVKLGISYNQFRLKSPLELYLHLNNLVSINNIVLSTDPYNKFDLGAYLFSVSVGLKFHFW